MTVTQFLRLILTISSRTNQIRVDAWRSTYTSSKFGEKFFKIKTKLLKLNDLKLCSGMEGRMKRGEMGGGAIFGQNIWVNIAIILGLYFFSSIIGNSSRSQQLVDTVQGSESLAGPRGLLEAYKLDIAVICRGLLHYQLEDLSLCTPAFSKVS